MSVRARFSSALSLRAATVTTAACAVAMATALPASAADAGAWTYRGPQECTYSKAAIATPATERTAAFGSSTVESWKNSPIGSCRQPDQRPAGYLTATAYLYKWDDLTRTWQLCRTSGRMTNSAPARQVEAMVPIRTASGAMPCGNGWYGTMAGGWQYSPSQHAWVGGNVWSGHHYYAPATTPDTPPPALRADSAAPELIPAPAQG
ncbi:hypothetical protein ACFYM0_02995 [Streptomyces sp. NPDC006487]|uniref:hypothetical protein n=1 Tax=Streptomyces sp. NPDC006487 TaxID=3364748 RepID=UPI0036878808